PNASLAVGKLGGAEGLGAYGQLSVAYVIPRAELGLLYSFGAHDDAPCPYLRAGVGVAGIGLDAALPLVSAGAGVRFGGVKLELHTENLLYRDGGDYTAARFTGVSIGYVWD